MKPKYTLKFEYLDKYRIVKLKDRKLTSIFRAIEENHSDSLYLVELRSGSGKVLAQLCV